VVSEIGFEAPTWDKLYEMLLDLAEKIKESGFKPDTIVGVSRGGWLPARVLTDLLDNPTLANARAEFYLGIAKTEAEPKLTQSVSTEVAGKRVLIVDEVADTGKSLKIIKEHLTNQGAKEIRIATVYYKPWSAVKADYCGKITKCWIVFSWEFKETIRGIVKKRRDDHKSIEEAMEKLVKAGVPERLVRRFLKEIYAERNR